MGLLYSDIEKSPVHNGNCFVTDSITKMRFAHMYLPLGFNFLLNILDDDLSPECRKLVGRKRIRKEVNRLTSDEKSLLNDAMKKAMKPHPDNGFSI